MKPYVWIVGFPRCGGASLCHALEILGWNPLHNPRNWDQLEGHNAAGDVMITAHWRELYRMFPGSRFVLNTRDFGAWTRSLRRIPGFWRSGFLYDRYYRQAVYQTDDKDDVMTLGRVWEQHHTNVVTTIPPGQLLVFPQPFTWEPLCRFVNRPVPGNSFPWLNRGSNRDAKIRLGQ
jgi:hypothetical protein